MARLLVAFFFLLAGFSAEATDKTLTISFSGEGAPQPIVLSVADVAGYPQIVQDVSFMTSTGQSSSRYQGVLLWTVLEKWASSLSDRHGYLRKIFVATGGDDYAIAYSVGEIAPDFGNRAMMLAIQQDGKPLPDGQAFRLIVPGDKRGARSVRDVVRIEVR